MIMGKGHDAIRLGANILIAVAGTVALFALILVVASYLPVWP